MIASCREVSRRESERREASATGRAPAALGLGLLLEQPQERADAGRERSSAGA